MDLPPRTPSLINNTLSIQVTHPSTVLYHGKGLPVNLQHLMHSCRIYTATTVTLMFQLHMPHTGNKSTYLFQIKKTRQFLKSWLFWDITQHWLVACYRCFRTPKCWQLLIWSHVTTQKSKNFIYTVAGAWSHA
jgi:hypothetical protein